MIGLCTDSNSQLPAALAQRFGIEVVPLTVVADEHEYLEGVDLDADGFYDLYADGHIPEVTFAVPSVGQFALAYDDLVHRGCTQILSIHTSAAVPGTLNAARMAAHGAPVPVRVVDSGIARFGVSCCVWAAAEALAEGASFDEIAIVAETLAPVIGNSYVVGALKLLHRPSPDGISVLTLAGNEPVRLERVCTVVDAVNAMARYTLGWGDSLKVAVGTAHRSCLPIGDALAHAIGESAKVREVVQFRIGPSVGAESGPGTVGCVVYPT